MSRENVEKLRAFCAGWGPFSDEFIADDFDMSLLDPDVTYEDTVLPDHVGEAYRGHEGVARATGRWIEPYRTLTIELQQIVGTGDRLVSIHRARAIARETGLEFEVPVAYAWTFRDGRVIHFKSFLDPDEALEAAGLRE